VPSVWSGLCNRQPIRRRIQERRIENAQHAVRGEVNQQSRFRAIPTATASKTTVLVSGLAVDYSMCADVLCQFAGELLRSILFHQLMLHRHLT
jgi:hypothetical protein